MKNEIKVDWANITEAEPRWEASDRSLPNRQPRERGEGHQAPKENQKPINPNYGK